MPVRGRKQVIAILLKLKAKGKLSELFKGSVPRAGAHQLPVSRPLESLRRAILSSAPIDKAWRMPIRAKVGGASSRPYVLHLRGGQKALFKPLETGGGSEILAYQTSKILGFPSVPPTVLRKTSWGLGSVQQWIRGKERDPVSRALLEAVKLQKRLKGKTIPPILKQWREMKVFDFLIGNYDRAPGNFKWDSRANHLVAIDNAEGFLSDSPAEGIWESMHMDRTLTEMTGLEKQQVSRSVKRFLRRRDHLEGAVFRLPPKVAEGMLLDSVFLRAQYFLDKIGKKSLSKRGITQE